MSEDSQVPEEKKAPARKPSKRRSAAPRAPAASVTRNEVEEIARRTALEVVSALRDDLVAERATVTEPGREESFIRRTGVTDQRCPPYDPADPDWFYQKVPLFSDEVEAEMQDRVQALVESPCEFGKVEIVWRGPRTVLLRMPRREYERRKRKHEDDHAVRLYGEHGNMMRNMPDASREMIYTAEEIMAIEAETGQKLDPDVREKLLASLANE